VNIRHLTVACVSQTTPKYAVRSAFARVVCFKRSVHDCSAVVRGKRLRDIVNDAAYSLLGLLFYAPLLRSRKTFKPISVTNNVGTTENYLKTFS